MGKTTVLILAVLAILNHTSCSPIVLQPTSVTTDTPEATEAVATTTATTTTAATPATTAAATTTTTTTPAPTTPPPTTSPTVEIDCSNTVLGALPVLGDVDDEMKIFNRRYVPLRNCKELMDSGFKKSGLYVIQPGMEGGEFVVYCDMCLLGGGWTVIQRRTNGTVDFERDYASYKHGFGDYAGEFWLGLSKMNRLTEPENTETPVELYIGLEAFFGVSRSARYSSFSVGKEEEGYKLQVGGYDNSGYAGDSLLSHNGQKFSTHDNDQDQQYYNCAETFKGGWWYKDCHDSNLNGLYYKAGENIISIPDGITWQSWLGDIYSLKTTVLAIR